MFKRVVIILLVLTVALGSGIYAETDTATEEIYSWATEATFLRDLSMTNEDLTRCERLYNEILTLEKANDLEGVNEKMKAYQAIVEPYMIRSQMMHLTWTDESVNLKELGVKDSDINVLKVLFEAAKKAETDNNLTLALEKWGLYFKKLNEVMPEMTSDNNFETEAEYFRSLGVSETDINALKAIFDEIVTFEKNGSYDKIDEAYTRYEAILKRYGKGNETTGTKK